MPKSWFDTEDGRHAKEAVQDHPESLQLFGEAAKEHLATLQERLLGMNIADATKDREFIVLKAQYDGAQGMVRYIKQLLEKHHKGNK